MSGFDPSSIADTLLSRAGLAQIGVVSLAIASAWITARALQARLPEHLQPGLAKIGAGSAYRLVTPLLLLALAWIGRFALAKWQPVPILNVVIPLIAAFAVIRLAVYLLRHMMAPSALLKSSERLIVLCIWVLFALYITGILAEIGAALEDVILPIGNKKVTLRLVLEAGLSAVVTVFIALGLSGLIEARLMRAEALDLSSRVVISRLTRALALMLAVLITLPLVGFDLTMLSVFGGALGVGLGLGLQKIASNYVSGFIILLDRSIRPGDLVTVDNRHGVISAIKARHTVIRGLDGTEAIVPNDALVTNTVLNHSYTDRTISVKTAVTIGYECNLDQACQLMTRVATGHARVLAEPAPTVLVKALGENGIELELNAWIYDAEQGQSPLRSDLLKAIWREFQLHAISVPFPQRVVCVASPPAEAKADNRPLA